MATSDENMKDDINPSLSTENSEMKIETKEADKPSTGGSGDEEDKKSSEESSELEKYWKAVKDNPADFTGWTYLLQFVEQENKLEHSKDAFDSFLARYPYCYGYWKKYTDFLKKHDQLDCAEEVFERGVKAIPLSIDLWIHYINFSTIKYSGLPVQESKVRELFERAIIAAGTDFRSDKLWDMYLTWEKENKSERAVTALYDRLLKIPTQLYSHHYESFCSHVKEHHPKNLVSLDEFLRLRKEVAKPIAEGHQAEEVEEADDEAPPGVVATGEEVDKEEAPPGVDDEPPPGVEVDESVTSPTTAAKPLGDEAEVPLLREKIIELRQVIHKKTEEEVSKRWSFEERVRRPYFHVKPLERAQLRNWREYLDFEIKQGSHERVVVLFERCLIACALYEEFWLKYAEYMNSHSVDGVRSVFQRACQIHLPKKPSLHLAWAAFEERQENYKGAVSVFDQLDVNIPGLAMVGLRRISMERRQGNVENVVNTYKNKIKETQSTQVKTFYAIKYARYLSKNVSNIIGAKEVLEDAMKEDPNNPKLILQLIDLEFNQPLVNDADMCTQFDRGIQSSLAVEHRVAFSQRKLEYLEDFGSDVSKLLEAYECHQKLVKELQSSRKRKSTDPQTDLTSAESKRSKSESSATISAPPTTHPVTAVTTNGATGDQVSSTTDAAAYYNTGQYNYQYGMQNYNYGWGQYGYYQ